MSTKPYVVRQGDHLNKLAHQLGFCPQRVWDDPANADLREVRGDGSQLRAGDVLQLPDEPRKRLPYESGQTNEYVAKLPTLPIEVRIGSVSELLVDEPYRVEGVGDEAIEGTTDGEGLIKLQVPVNTRQLVVVLPERDERFQVMVGDLDPIDEASGLRMRLTNLGYYGTTVAGEDGHVTTEDEQLTAALKAFQTAAGLEPSGVLDEQSRSMLIDAHGS